MRLYVRDQEIEDCVLDDAHYDEAVVHICQLVGEWRCEIRVVRCFEGRELVLWKGECDNELRLDDCVLVRDDE